MKRISSFFLFVCILISFNSSGFAQPASHLPPADNQFAFDLYSRLSSNKGNIFFSPYSLSTALDMAYEGARGETAQEMGAVLHLDLTPDNLLRRSQTSAFIQQINRKDKAYELSVANALWAQKHIRLRRLFKFDQEYLFCRGP